MDTTKSRIGLIFIAMISSSLLYNYIVSAILRQYLGIGWQNELLYQNQGVALLVSITILFFTVIILAMIFLKRKFPRIL